MTKQRLVLIANPSAGKDRGEQFLRAAEEELRRLGQAPELRRTSSAGDAARFAEEAARDGADVVVAVGGDGTLHEIVNGLLRAETADLPTLGVIPVGTGNDYAKMLRVPKRDPVAAARILALGEARPVDLGRIEGGDVGPEYFINNVGLSFMAEANAAHERTRYLPGRLSYVVGGFASFVRFEADLMTVNVDGVTVQDRFMVVHIGIGRFCGGGVDLTPRARHDDGKLAVCLVTERSKLKALMQWSQISEGRRLDDTTVLEANRVTVQGPLGFLIHADGEVRTVPTGVLVVTILPGRLRVLHAL